MTTARDVSPMWPRDWLSTGAGSTRAADEVAAPGSTSRSIADMLNNPSRDRYHHYTLLDDRMSEDEDEDTDEEEEALEFGSIASQITFDSLEEEVRSRAEARRSRSLPISQRRTGRPTQFHSTPYGEAELHPPAPLQDQHVRPGSPPRPNLRFDTVQDGLMPETNKTYSPLGMSEVRMGAGTAQGAACAETDVALPHQPVAGPSQTRSTADLGPCLHLSSAHTYVIEPCSFLRPGLVFSGRQHYEPIQQGGANAVERRQSRKRRTSATDERPSHIPSSSLDLLPAIRRVNASVDPPAQRRTVRRASYAEAAESARRAEESARRAMERPRSSRWISELDRRYGNLLSTYTGPVPEEEIEWAEMFVEEVEPKAPLQPTAWDVRVSIHNVDLQRGTISGVMYALNIRVESTNGGPPSYLPVTTTAFDGELIDGRTHGLWTDRWGASREEDARHWSQLACFEGLGEEGVRAGHAKPGFILARLKERGFVNVEPGSSGLTIDGCYYVSLNRNGTAMALYYDPTSSSRQRLNLRAFANADNAVPFATFDVC